jgi:hypothetical protein
MNKDGVVSNLVRRAGLATGRAAVVAAAATVFVLAPSGHGQVRPAMMIKLAPPPAAAEEEDAPVPPEGEDAPPEGGEEGATGAGKKVPPVTLSKEEVEELKAEYEAASPEEQAVMQAHFADLGVNLDMALGLASAKSAEQGRTQELLGSMREMDFSRQPQAVLAARAKLGFGQVPQPNAASARALDVAKWIHLHVMAGEWGVLGSWLKGRPEVEAQGIYSAILQSMNRGDPGLLPEEVLALAEASPGELKTWQMTSLCSLLKRSADKHSVGPMLEQIKAGTRLMGKQDAEHRRRTVDFLAGAGLVIEAYDFLPPLEEARAALDSEVLLVHAKYKQSLADKDGPGPRADAWRVEAWELYSQISLLSKASVATRRDAIGRGIGLMNNVPRAQITPWLEQLFASETLGPTALELMALKAVSIGDEKLSDEDRAQAILTMKESVDVLLARTPAENAGLRVPMRMLTTALLTEMENTVKQKGREQILAREAQLLLRAMPSKKWFDALEPSLATRAFKACIGLATVADETDMAISLMRDGIARSPESAQSLADHFLSCWEQRLNPGDQEEDDEMRMYYFYRSFIPAAPLTRGRQRRNLDRLHQVMDTLQQCGIEPRTLPSIASAFKACHSRTEVFDREEISRVFGDMKVIPPVTASALARTMASSLNGDWRNRAAQQKTGTKRSDSEIAAMVDKGYGLALELVDSALAQQPKSWQNAALKAGLSYDRMQFKNAQQKQDPAVLNEYRKAAFEAFEQAAGQYAAALASGQEREDATVYVVWFGAAMGTPQLNFVSVDELPTEGSLQDDQIDRVRKAITALPPDSAFRHISDFARAMTNAVARADPEVKPRLVKHALRVVGDHPAGATLRSLEELYRDLVKDEIKLRVSLDGQDSVGVGKPFGMLVSLRFTNAVDRETGGFAKYLQNNVYGRVGRSYREINYRDAFQKEIETALSKSFSIESVGFFDPFMPPRGVTESGQDGWLEKPMAYVIVTRKDPSVDRVPQVAMDMQFDDQNGPVTLALPSNTPPLAVGDARTARPCSDATVAQIIDVRNARNGDKGGTVTLEVQIRGKGVVPDLREALDGIDTAIEGYEIAPEGIEVKPTLVLQEGSNNGSRFYWGPPQPPKEGYPEPDAAGMYRLTVERSWVVTYTPKGSRLGSSFKVPVLKEGIAAKLESRYFTDMDLVPVQGAAVDVQAQWSTGLRVATGLGAVAAAGLLVFAVVRRRKSTDTGATQESLLPERLTPMSVVTTLRRLQTRGGATLDSATIEALNADIVRLERQYFGPAATPSANGDELSSTIKRWEPALRAAR